MDKMISRIILEQFKEGEITEKAAFELLNCIGKEKNVSEPVKEKDIAVIGLAVRAPGALNEEQFWEGLLDGNNNITEFPEHRKEEMLRFVPENLDYAYGGYLKHIFNFDYPFFRISPKEAFLMDPHQRIMLETAWDAVENSGWITHIYGKNVGVYIAREHSNEMLYKRIVDGSEMLSITGNTSSILASRISYVLNLKGPAIVVDTACSGSMTALHLACEALKNNEIEMAIVGGINLSYCPIKSNSMVESDNKVLNVFSKNSNGTVWAEAAGAVVLRRFCDAKADHDYIRGVVKGTGINNNGKTSGISAPNALMQEENILSVWKKANINPETISFFESHGTGTELGDSIEFKSITKAFSKYTEKAHICALGSVKANIGHTSAAAGIMSLVKVIKILENGQVPPLINFDEPSSYIDFERSALYINQKVIPLPQKITVHRAALNSFGFSGTNFHAVVEQAPKYVESNENPEQSYIFLLSAKTQSALLAYILKYQEYMHRNKGYALSDICCTAARGRKHYAFRLAVICSSIPELIQRLDSIDRESVMESNQDQGIFFTNGHNWDEKINYENLYSLAKGFVGGMDLDWDRVFKNEWKKVPLPTYPFEALRCFSGDALYGKKVVRTFLHDILINQQEETLFVTLISADVCWIINEHQLHNVPTMPGTAYIEMMIEAVQTRFGPYHFHLENLFFIKLFQLKQNESQKIYTRVFSKGIKNSIEIYSIDNGKKYLHAKAEIKFDRKSVNSAWLINIEEFTQNAIKIKDLLSLVSTDMKFGSHWLENRICIMENADEVKFCLMADERWEDIEEYMAYPPLLDIATSVGSINEELMIPFGYGQLSFYGPLSGKILGISRWNNRKNRDIQIFDKSGKLLVEVKDFIVRKADKQVETSANHYQVLWKKYNNLPVMTSEMDKCLIFSNKMYRREETGATREAVCTDPIYVKKRKIDTQKGESDYYVDNTEDSYYKLFLKVGHENISNIIYAYPAERVYMGEVSPQFLKNRELFDEDGINDLLGLLYLVKGLTKAWANKKYNIHLTVIIHNGHRINQKDKVDPFATAITGLVRTMENEYDKLVCRCIDVDTTEDILKVVSFANQSEVSVVSAIRNQVLYVQEFSKGRIKEKEKNAISIKENGVYLITGGLGGLGLLTAKYLSAKTRMHIILVGRKLITDIQKTGSNDLTDEQSNIIEKMLNSDCTLDYISADVCKDEDVQRLAEYVSLKYGKINGIFHAAGIPGNGILLEKNKDEFLSVLMPKIQGTLILHKYFCDCEFMLLYSSVASYIGGIGQGDYSAANAFLDGFAQYCEHKSLRCYSINWGPWRNIGMNANQQTEKSQIIRPIVSETALKLMEDVFVYGLTNDIIADIDVEQLKYNFTEKSTVKESQKKASKKKDIIQTAELRCQKVTDSKYEKHKVLEHVTEVWCNVFGMDQIEPDSDFYMLGGDSIQAIQITNQVNEIFGLHTDITMLIDGVTLKQYTEELQQLMMKQSNSDKDINELDDNIVIPLSNSQQRIWFHQKLYPSSVIYNLDIRYDLKQHIDVETARKALQIVIDRQQMLRTTFVERDGVPYQVVRDQIVNLTVTDISDAENSEKLLDGIIYEENHRVFNLDKECARYMLIKLADNHWIFCANIHHIISDGWSMRILTEELLTAYRSLLKLEEISLPPLQIQYKDWVLQQEQWLLGEECLRMEKYWLSQLTQPLPVLNLPLDHKRPKEQKFEGSYFEQETELAVSRQIEEFTRSMRISNHVFFLSVFFAFLYRMTNDKDIIVGVPVAGRDHVEIERLIGLFINILAIRIHIDTEWSFWDLVTRVKETHSTGIKNSKYPFDCILQKAEMERRLDRNAVYTVLFQFFQDAQVSEDSSAVDLYLSCRKSENSNYLLRMEYNSKIFDKETIRRFMGYYIKLLEIFSGEFNGSFAKAPLLSNEETYRIVKEFNNTECEPATQLICKTLSRIANAFPYKNAIYDKERVITYGEFHSRTNQLARTLVNKGVSRNCLVALNMDKSVDMLFGIVAILKAGGAYMPIAADMSLDKVEQRVELADIQILLTNRELHFQKADIQVIDVHREDSYHLDSSELLCSNQPSDLMYVLYTSGSSGAPKGIPVNHGSVANLLGWLDKRYPLQSEDVIFHRGTFTFDGTIPDVFWWMYKAAGVSLLDAEDAKNLENIINTIYRDGATVTTMVPSLLEALLQFLLENQEQQIKIKSIRKVFCGGEVLSPLLIRLFYQVFDQSVMLTNVYGPTEATVDATSYLCTPLDGELDTVPIGSPLDNYQIYILNEFMQIQPIGVVGEIYIGGAGLSRGYLNEPEMTAERFVVSPFDKLSRIYKTGDLGYWRPDGNIEYCGRNDSQIKVRGYRIELEEIENQLEKIDGVIKGIVKEGMRKNGRTEELQAYLLMDKELTVDRLRDSLSETLPDYMIPSKYFAVEQFPYLPSGKIDRKSVNEGRPLKYMRETGKTLSKTEMKLFQIWSEILETADINPENSFFNQGGNSLMILKLHNKIKSEFKCELQVADCFRFPTIIQMAVFLDERQSEYNSGEETKKESVFDLISQRDFDIDKVLDQIN